MNKIVRLLLVGIFSCFFLLSVQIVSGKNTTPLLMRQDATPATCIISTTEAKTISVRVGPGENRTPVAFLPVNVEFTVLGRYVADDESVWYQIDPKQAAPKKTINEAWVGAAGLDEQGDCEAIADADAPPIIPIRTHPTAVPAGSEQPAEQPADSGSVPAGAITLQSGNYSVYVSPQFNASCEGYANQRGNTSDIGFYADITSLVVRGNTIYMEGYPTTLQSNGSYVGKVEYSGFYGTFVIWPASPTTFSGEIIISFSYSGVNCSGTITYTASRM